MSTLNPGDNTTISLQAGKVLRVKADAIGTGTVWNSGAQNNKQDTIARAVAAGGVYHFGPYGQAVNLRVECATGTIDIQSDFIASPAGYEVARQMGTLVKAVAGSAYTLSDSDHGFVLLVAAACTITIPKGLRSDFSCGWSQESSGAVTFAAGAGATLNSKGGTLASSAQYQTGGLAAFAQDVFRLTGV